MARETHFLFLNFIIPYFGNNMVSNIYFYRLWHFKVFPNCFGHKYLCNTFQSCAESECRKEEVNIYPQYLCWIKSLANISLIAMFFSDIWTNFIKHFPLPLFRTIHIHVYLLQRLFLFFICFFFCLFICLFVCLIVCLCVCLFASVLSTIVSMYLHWYICSHEIAFCIITLLQINIF